MPLGPAALAELDEFAATFVHRRVRLTIDENGVHLAGLRGIGCPSCGGPKEPEAPWVKLPPPYEYEFRHDCGRLWWPDRFTLFWDVEPTLSDPDLTDAGKVLFIKEWVMLKLPEAVKGVARIEQIEKRERECERKPPVKWRTI